MAIIEDVSAAGLERNRWWFHRLSEAQGDGAKDGPAQISIRSSDTLFQRRRMKASITSALATGIEGDPVRNAG
jgi:hypothetical protein